MDDRNCLLEGGKTGPAIVPGHPERSLLLQRVGQADAKKAVAVAIRNRWRRQQLPEDMRKDVTPKNIVLIGPTGVSKKQLDELFIQLKPDLPVKP